MRAGSALLPGRNSMGRELLPGTVGSGEFLSWSKMARMPNGFSGAFARALKFWPLGKTAHRYAPRYNAF